MMIFTTSIAKQFSLSGYQGSYTLKKFSDGELYIHIDEDVRNKEVSVIASTQTPAEHLLELLFLLDALQRAEASITLFITYFGYARQIIAAPGEALSAQVIANMFMQFSLKNVYILHPHSLLLQKYLTFTPMYNLEFFCAQAHAYDAIAAPDKGAVDFAQKVAQLCNKELIMISKKRPVQEQVEIVAIDGNVMNKKILLVDDMIATGRTLVTAAQSLIQHGACQVAAAATHGVFSVGSREFLEHSVLQKIIVTNSIAQESQGKITVIDISNFIQKQLL